ncbi:MAG: hypothetical protein L6Q75_08270 [Burkholderiaceae bacterium]|nr:hypothetical protein [Burkholderiaceae bacterium]
MNGGAGNDIYRVGGNRAEGWASFEGYDSYADSAGSDAIQAYGGNVDVGVNGWNGSGVEVIDGTRATGTVTLVDNGNANVIDLRSTALVGGNIVLNGNAGNDTIWGSGGNDVLMGDIGDDRVDGGQGADIYRVTGNRAGGWASFHGYDTYLDSGGSGSDTLQAVGTGDVDIGMSGWGSTGIEVIDGSQATGKVWLIGNSASNVLDFSRTTFIGSNFVFNGYAGNDTITGTAGADVIMGDIGDDRVDGGQGADVYRVTGNRAGGWASFHGYDTYLDSGSSGSDTLQAVGMGDVDIGMSGWGSTGIEVIDGSQATGKVWLIGNSASNVLDFSRTTFIGSNFVFDGYAGNDTIIGAAGDDTIVGNIGDDRLDGGEGSDTYLVTGNQAGGWASFHSYDTHADSGTTGIDRLIAQGSGDVDIGLATWSAANGIDVFDLSGVAGKARILGSGSANLLDFRDTSFVNPRGGLLIDGSYGNDSIFGAAGQDTLIGSFGNDLLDGGAGDDVYQFARGAGSDRITDSDATAGNIDTLAFAAGVTVDQLWFRHVGNDLEVRVIGSSDIVTITDWYSGSAHHVERFTTADGQTLQDSQVENLVTAMGGLALPAWGQTSLPTAYQATLLPLIDGLWV